MLSRNNEVLFDGFTGDYPKQFFIDARRSYSVNKSRFHEFMVSIIGITAFDIIELCFASDATDNVSIVASVFRDRALAEWYSLTLTYSLTHSLSLAYSLLLTHSLT